MGTCFPWRGFLCPPPAHGVSSPHSSKPEQALCFPRSLSSCACLPGAGRQPRVRCPALALPPEDGRTWCSSVYPISDALRLKSPLRLDPSYSQAPHSQTVTKSCPCYTLKFSEPILCFTLIGPYTSSGPIISFLQWPLTQPPCLRSTTPPILSPTLFGQSLQWRGHRWGRPPQEGCAVSISAGAGGAGDEPCMTWVGAAHLL